MENCIIKSVEILRVDTDHKWYPLFDGRYLTPKEKASFANLKLNDDEISNSDFFKCRGHWYCLEEFSKIDYGNPSPMLKNWDYISATSEQQGMLLEVRRDRNYRIGFWIAKLQ